MSVLLLINDLRFKYVQGENLDEVDVMVAQLMTGSFGNSVGLSPIEYELKERIQRVSRVQAAIIYSPDIVLGMWRFFTLELGISMGVIRMMRSNDQS